MMIGERNRLNPTIQIPDWSPLDDSTVVASPFSPMNSPSALDPVMALHRFLPSNESDFSNKEMQAFSCDHFRMFEFKIRMCARGRSHDWTECPYAHPGEKARRRDPVKYYYSGASCPDLRKGICKKGDSCEFAHGVFECWLHPARYRTQPCKDGMGCPRRVCFFAHSAEQLRVLPQQSPMVHGSTESFEGSRIRRAFEINMTKGYPSLSSPTSILNSPPLSPSDSPPVSPVSPQVGSGFGSPKSVYELLTSMRNLHVGNTKSSRQREKPSVSSLRSSTLRPAFCDYPTRAHIPTHSGGSFCDSPTRAHIPTHSGGSFCDFWDQALMEDPAMKRVESGREIRAQMYVKLSQENSLGSADPAPDIGWVSELVM